MIKNYLLIALRNILRHKSYSALNIAGLAIGMACSIIILLWVQHEWSFDRFHANANQLYRMTSSAGDFKAAVTPAGMAEGIQKEIPLIRSSVRLSKPTTNLFEVGLKKFEEKNGYYVDSNFLQIFSFPLLNGDAHTALAQPNAILITPKLAEKYFGKDDPMGKIIRRDNYKNVVVAGILAPVPSNSHLQFDFLLPISSIANEDYDIKNKVWTNFNYYTYFLVNKDAAGSTNPGDQVALQINKIYTARYAETKIQFELQPLTKIHLYSHLQIDLPGHGNIQYVNIFFLVAFFILAVACINFMNLATARSAQRAKEVGLRKVVGAGRGQLIIQFLGESILISIVSLLVALGIVALLLPAFNNLADKQLSLSILDSRLILILISIALATGVISGSYPALFLSGFNPIKIVKGKMQLSGANLLFRNGLVVTQFVAAIILLIGTAVVYKQLKFIQSKNLGFEKSNLVYIPMTGDIWGKQQALKTLLESNPLTKDYSIISDLPISLVTGTLDVEWEGKDPQNKIVVPSIDVDDHFTDVFQMKMLSGRSFSKEFSDSASFVVNEKALQVMGIKLDQAVGKSLTFSGVKGIIIGVIQDFNFKPLQYAIDPLVLRKNKYGGMIMVRLPTGNTGNSIVALEKISTELNPAYPFVYNFLDKDLDDQYKGEKKMGSIFNLFALLAVFISCLGLYGLSAFTAEQRNKEIGVRKVLGASIINIVYMLSGNFSKLIIIASCIAIPLSWYGITSWLNGFAYRIEINWTTFLMACFAALLFGILTVSFESIKAAIANPIKSIRDSE